MLKQKTVLKKKVTGLKAGFTLIELLMVMALTIILLAAGLSSLYSSQQTMSFLTANEKLLSFFRTARTYAIAGRAEVDRTDYNNDGSTADSITPANYGINFTASAIRLFADIHADRTTGNPYSGKPVEGVFQDPGVIGSWVPGVDLILAQYTFPADLVLTAKAKPSNDAVNTLFFSPVYADVKFDPILKPGDTYVVVRIQRPAGQGIEMSRCYRIHPMAGNAELMDCAGF